MMMGHADARKVGTSELVRVRVNSGTPISLIPMGKLRSILYDPGDTKGKDGLQYFDAARPPGPTAAAA